MLIKIDVREKREKGERKKDIARSRKKSEIRERAHGTAYLFKCPHLFCPFAGRCTNKIKITLKVSYRVEV